MFTFLNMERNVKVFMLKQETIFQGYSLSGIEKDLCKLEGKIAWFGEYPAGFEYLEALVDTLRDKYDRILALEDDGTLPPVVTSLISALQQCDDMRR